MTVGPTVGIVCLGEAGNLGDDLILAAVVESVHKALPDARVRHLSFGQHLDWDTLGRSLDLPAPGQLERARAPRRRPWTKPDALFDDADIMVVGGGGLLHSTHHVLRPFQWFDYLPQDGAKPVVGVGLGIGPLSRYWVQYFRGRPSPFDRLYVRDDASLSFAMDRLGWAAERCLDFVDDELLLRVAGEAGAVAPNGRLGVSLRAWPGLSAHAVAEHIRTVGSRHGSESVELYVLEAKGDAGVDVEFTRAVLHELRMSEARMSVYDPADLSGFVASMAGCDAAIGMKLHACAIWATHGVPVYPIVYAPKVAAFYDLDYSGLRVYDRVESPSDSWLVGAAAGSEATGKSLSDLVERQVAGAHRFSKPERYAYRALSTAINVVDRMRREYMAKKS